MVGTGLGNSMKHATWNVAIGVESLYNTVTSDGNISIGNQVLYSLNKESNQDYNVAIGNQSLRSLTEGSYNIAIGSNVALDKTSGTNNIFIGNSANSSKNDNTTNEIVIGASVTGNGSNTTTIGNYETTDTYLGTSDVNNYSKLISNDVISRGIAFENKKVYIKSDEEGYEVDNDYLFEHDITAEQMYNGYLIFTNLEASHAGRVNELNLPNTSDILEKMCSKANDRFVGMSFTFKILVDNKSNLNLLHDNQSTTRLIAYSKYGKKMRSYKSISLDEGWTEFLVKITGDNSIDILMLGHSNLTKVADGAEDDFYNEYNYSSQDVDEFGFINKNGENLV